jgi:hypothetical protein
MPAINAAVLGDINQLYIALRMGTDKLERWAEFRRQAIDDPKHSGDAESNKVAEILDEMATNMEQRPKYFDPQVPESLRFVSEAIKDPMSATKIIIYGAVESIQNVIKFLARRALGIAVKVADAVEKRAVAASVTIFFATVALRLLPALAERWPWLAPVVEALKGVK